MSLNGDLDLSSPLFSQVGRLLFAPRVPCDLMIKKALIGVEFFTPVLEKVKLRGGDFKSVGFP